MFIDGGIGKLCKYNFVIVYVTARPTYLISIGIYCFINRASFPPQVILAQILEFILNRRSWRYSYLINTCEPNQIVIPFINNIGPVFFLLLKCIDRFLL